MRYNFDEPTPSIPWSRRAPARSRATTPAGVTAPDRPRAARSVARSAVPSPGRRTAAAAAAAGPARRRPRRRPAAARRAADARLPAHAGHRRAQRRPLDAQPGRHLPDDQPARGRGPGHGHRRRRAQAGHADRRRPRAGRVPPRQRCRRTSSPATPTAGPGTDLRGLLEQLHGAVRQVARTGTDAQLAAAAAILTEARRSLYLLLADGPEARMPELHRHRRRRRRRRPSATPSSSRPTSAAAARSARRPTASASSWPTPATASCRRATSARPLGHRAVAPRSSTA